MVIFVTIFILHRHGKKGHRDQVKEWDSIPLRG